MLNKDYKEMLQCLLEENVKFLLVGAYAVVGIIFQIGNSPRRIDIITSASGLDFEKAYSNKQIVILEGLEVPVISLQDLIVNKRASGRAQDLADVEKLVSTQKGKST
jgi:predicted nucleotidyltransferase